MFCNYKVQDNILYLYVDDKCEIGSLFNHNKNNTVIDKIKNYIKNNKIKFSGTMVILLLSGLMLGKVYLNNNDMSMKEKRSYKIDEQDHFVNDVILLKRTNGEVLKMNMQDYLIGVVAAQMPVYFNIEALKAQAVVARTYTLKLLEKEKIITDDMHIQAYKSNDELKKMWGSNYSKYYNKVKKAVVSTNNLCIKYNGLLIDAIYHSTSNGYTEDSANVWGNRIPYLKIVTSPWDTSVPSYLRTIIIGFDKVLNALKVNFDEFSKIQVISKDDSGRISKIKFNNKELSGKEVRNLLGLRSADFDAEIVNKGICFTTRGYGHGVGMSQYGANGMANSGYKFDQILKHYYTGVNIAEI